MKTCCHEDDERQIPLKGKWMQKIVFFTDRIFWPANDGHKVVLDNYCKGLAKEYDCDIHVLSFLEPGQVGKDKENPPAYISSVELVDKPPLFNVARNELRSLFRGEQGGPFQCGLFRSKSAADMLYAKVKQLNPTHVFIDLPRLAPFIKDLENLPCIKVLYMEDRFSKRYRRQADSLSTLKKTGGVAGKYSAALGGGLARVSSIKLLEKMLLRAEAKRMSFLEREAPNYFDYVVLVSPGEAKELATEVGADNIVSIPLGVDCSYYMNGPHPPRRANVLSFLGDMRSSANADSLRYIAKKVLPLLDDSVYLEISGTVPDELRREFEDNHRIQFLGRVDDTRISLRSSSVFLAPIAYGTGIKTKILEAMAIGVPVVTNSVGNEGIGLTNGVDAFVSDDAEALASAANRLLDDRALADQFVDLAREKALKEFDWKKSILMFSQLKLSGTTQGV